MTSIKIYARKIDDVKLDYFLEKESISTTYELKHVELWMN